MLPRNYGLVMERDSSDLFIPPASFAIGNVISTPAKELNRKLEQWQQAQTEAVQSYHNGREIFRWLFLVDRKHEGFLSLRPGVLREMLLEGIKKEETSKNLWLKGGAGAIEDGYFGRRVLSGRIKSKHDARRKDVLGKWQAMVRGGYDSFGTGAYRMFHANARITNGEGKRASLSYAFMLPPFLSTCILAAAS